MFERQPLPVMILGRQRRTLRTAVIPTPNRPTAFHEDREDSTNTKVFEFCLRVLRPFVTFVTFV